MSNTETSAARGRCQDGASKLLTTQAKSSILSKLELEIIHLEQPYSHRAFAHRVTLLVTFLLSFLLNLLVIYSWAFQTRYLTSIPYRSDQVTQESRQGRMTRSSIPC